MLRWVALVSIVATGLGVACDKTYYTAEKVSTLRWDVGPSPSVYVHLSERTISVLPGEIGEVEATVTTYATSSESLGTAEKYLKGAAVISGDRVGDGVRIITEQKAAIRYTAVYLQLRVPSDARLDLSTENGEISVGYANDGSPKKTRLAALEAKAAPHGMMINVEPPLSGAGALRATDLDLEAEGPISVVASHAHAIGVRAYRIHFAGALSEGTHSFQAKYHATLDLPSESQFRLDAKSAYGDVSSTFAGEWESTERPAPQLRGTVGVDPPCSLKIQSEHGPVAIHALEEIP
jgi:hypothetical protein